MGATDSKPALVDADEYVGDVKFEKSRPKEGSSYLNETLSDFKIIVKHNSGTWRFPCHKFVLCSDNNLLADQCLKLDSSEVTITDIEPQIMEIILRYIYEKEILLDDWKMACEILEAASHYRIEALVQECEKFLIRSLTLRNVCLILLKSDALSLTELKRECLEFCKNAAFIVLQTKSFMLLPEQLVREILGNDDVNVRGEMSVFQCLWSWSTVQCICKCLPLNENNVVTEFSSVADCVKFDCIGEKQRELLPEFVKSKYLKDNVETTSKVSNRYVQFPLNLQKNLYLTLMFDSKEKGAVNVDPIVGSFISCIKLCVKLDTYIISLSTLCLKKDSSLNTVKELKLSSAEGIVFLWNKDNEIFVEKKRSEDHVFSVYDSTMVTETEFHAVRPLALHVGLVYTLEITPSKSGLEWPQVIPKIERRKSDLEFALCTSLCCGLKSITFVQAK